jgi:hypothetical protein
VGKSAAVVLATLLIQASLTGDTHIRIHLSGIRMNEPSSQHNDFLTSSIDSLSVQSNQKWRQTKRAILNKGMALEQGTRV